MVDGDGDEDYAVPDDAVPGAWTQSEPAAAGDAHKQDAINAAETTKSRNPGLRTVVTLLQGLLALP
jgi:hypothetical protein